MSADVVSSLRVLDLHPEELLERDALGELDDTERARLQAHLDRCATCRFERQLRADFEDEIDADHLPVAPIGLVADVLARVSGPSLTGNTREGDGEADADVAPLPSPRAPRSSARRRAVRAVWMLSAAALLLLAGGAAAAIGLGIRTSLPALLGYAPRVSAPAAIATSTPAPKSHLVAAAASPAPVETAPAPAEIPASAVTATAEVPTLLARPHREPGPQELFDAETIARHHGDYARVFALHHELDQRFPRSRETQVSRATVGHLQLDRGDPTAALTDFDAYLAGGSGNLGEEAMVGRAMALDRLGRSDEASVAWRALVAAFPDTPYAAHARARVETLTRN
jgi:TolA-binding protein